jgi:hypothetical protein
LKQSLPVLEGMADKGMVLEGIGDVYKSWKKNNPAFDAYNKAFHIYKDFSAVSVFLGKETRALELYNNALRMAKMTGQKKEVEILLHDIETLRIE